MFDTSLYEFPYFHENYISSQQSIYSETKKKKLAKSSKLVTFKNLFFVYAQSSQLYKSYKLFIPSFLESLSIAAAARRRRRGSCNRERQDDRNFFFGICRFGKFNKAMSSSSILLSSPFHSLNGNSSRRMNLSRSQRNFFFFFWGSSSLSRAPHTYTSPLSLFFRSIRTEREKERERVPVLDHLFSHSHSSFQTHCAIASTYDQPPFNRLSFFFPLPSFYIAYA